MKSLITKDVSCLLNNYFSSVFTLEGIQNIPKPIRIFKGDIDTEGLLISLITSELVEKKLEKLNVNKCPGLDGIHPRMLFELKKYLARPLSILFSASLEFGVEFGITPLFKKGRKSVLQNYRPINLTCVVCKIMRSIIKDCISIN